MMRVSDGFSGCDGGDELILARVAAGDSCALAALYDRYGRLALWLANQMMDDPAAAEDVVQDVFLSVWKHAGGYDPRKSTVRRWVLSAVRHRCIDLRRRSITTCPLGPENEEKLATSADHVWEAFGPEIDAADVRRALDTLPEEQRATVRLAFFDGLTHAQIASRERIPLGTVKGRMRLALVKLRAALVNSSTSLSASPPSLAPLYSPPP